MNEADQVPQQQQEGTTTETLGGQLRRRRQERGLRVEDIAHHLKLDPQLLHAFEEDREPPRDLPEVFCKGFLRSYSRYLGVEIPPGQQGVCRPRQVVVERGASGHNHGPRLWPFVALGAIVVVAATTGGDLGRIGDWLQGKEQPTPTVVEKGAGEKESAVAEPAIVTPTKRMEGSPEEDGATATNSERPTAPEKGVPSPEVETDTAEKRVEDVEPAATTGSAVVESASAETETAPVIDEHRGEVTIRYKRASFTQVSDGLGRVLVKQSFEAGAVERFEGPLPLELHLGNAAGVQLEFNGEPYDHLNYIEDNNTAHFRLGEAE